MAVNVVQRVLPFLDWIKELKDPSVLRADVIAGITVALVLIPQSMAYAQLAGLDPYYGLYAAFVPPIVSALFGSSRQLQTGPVAIASLMTAAAIAPVAAEGTSEYVAACVLLCVLAGIFQLLLGVFRLGVLVNFLSSPVVAGFTNAAAIIIGTSQLAKIFGVKVERTDHHYLTTWNTITAAVESLHFETLMMALLAIVILYGFKKFLPKLPGVLVAVIITTLIAKYAGFEGKVVGDIPKGLPPFAIPSLDWSLIGELTAMSIAIALMGFMEAISIAKTMAAKSKQKLDPNQELIGQGLGKIAGSFFQSYVVSGSFSRSAVNFDAGAVTGFSSVVTGLMVVVALFFLTPLLYFLPHATLAAVIIVSVVGLVDFKPLIKAFKTHRHDGLAAFTTFFLTLGFAPRLERGIIIGVGLSLVLYLYRTMKPRVSNVSRYDDTTFRSISEYNLASCQKIALIRFEGPLYFANTGYFEDKIMEAVSDQYDLKYVIIDCIGMSEIDATGEDSIKNVHRRLKEAGISLVLTRLTANLEAVLDSSGVIDELGKQSFKRNRESALREVFELVHCGNPGKCPLMSPVKKEDFDPSTCGA